MFFDQTMQSQEDYQSFRNTPHMRYSTCLRNLRKAREVAVDS